MFIFVQVGQTSSSLTLQWREPCNSGADITSYNIDIIGHQVENYVPSGNETFRDIDEKPFKTLEYTLLGLQPNTQYR